MLEKIINYLSNKKNNWIISKDFSFLDFSDDNEEKEFFYLEKIWAKNFLENENWVVLDNSKWEDAYEEIKAMWMFWIENFSYFLDLLFTWKTTNKSIIDCLNIESRIKKNNYIELTLQLRDYETDNQIIIKRIFQNIEHDSCENNFYYYEKEELTTTNSEDEIVKRRFRTMKNYNRTLFLAQILYSCIDEKNKLQKELNKLKLERSSYKNKDYKVLREELKIKYEEEEKLENQISNILNKYNKQALYEVMDYVNKNPRVFAKTEGILQAGMIIDFLYNIWFTNIPQIEANKMFDIVNKDPIRYEIGYPIKDLFYYFKTTWEEDKNLPFEFFIMFFNTLLTCDKTTPIDIKNIELYKKNWVQTPYNTKEFWDYVKQTLLDENWNIRLEVLENNFLSEGERFEKVRKLTNEVYENMWINL